MKACMSCGKGFYSPNTGIFELCPTCQFSEKVTTMHTPNYIGPVSRETKQRFTDWLDGKPPKTVEKPKNWQRQFKKKDWA